MAKYIIDIPDNTHWIQWIMEGTKDHHPYTDWKMVEDLIPYTEQDRKAIEDEVWEFASMLMNTHPDVAEDIYWSMNGGKGIGVSAEMTYSEAKAKYEAWKKKKEEIRVGDEVKYRGDNCVVVYVGADEVYHLSDKHWSRCVVQGRQFLTKTGRHFEEVEKLLERMR